MLDRARRARQSRLRHRIDRGHLSPLRRCRCRLRARRGRRRSQSRLLAISASLVFWTAGKIQRRHDADVRAFSPGRDFRREQGSIMKFTLSWLKDHLDTDEPVEKLADKLTMIGLEVEHIEDKAKALAPFTIARVISADQHPNADRLRVCMVDTGSGDPVQVVCGAPNARTGMKGVFAPPGTFIPGKNITLGVGTIRGVESRGMLVSEAELEISDDHEGILDLPPDAPVGARYAEWAHLDDPVIEINLTPNRPDCTGIHGIARDLAAA